MVLLHLVGAVCDTAKVRFFKQITTCGPRLRRCLVLFVILQKYDFSSKSQPQCATSSKQLAVCDTAKVRFFKQITTFLTTIVLTAVLFVILQKYDFSSKSQQDVVRMNEIISCLWYCKSTIFQANHNEIACLVPFVYAVCDTAKVRFFKQITTLRAASRSTRGCLWYCKSTIFQANHNP